MMSLPRECFGNCEEKKFQNPPPPDQGLTFEEVKKAMKEKKNKKKSK